LDKDQLSNYRPISNLSLISKIIERIVKVRLTNHLSSNNLLNPHQPAYSKHHSTETALLYIHERLQAKYSRLRLFNVGEMSCFNQHNAVQ